jgi:glycosyltransferase involved in cell wall biosynthesis
MGSDLLMKDKPFFQSLLFNISKYLSIAFASKIIVKSKKMIENLPASKKIILLPNGVNTKMFYPQNKDNAKDLLGWDSEFTNILFAANPLRKEKNFKLFQDSIALVPTSIKIKIHTLVNIPFEQIPIYMNAADVVVLTSIYEGSPNVIKEALACNSIIVSTDVGDVRELIGEIEGCFISTFEVENLVKNLEQAIEYSKNGNNLKGLEQIFSKFIDEDSIAKKLIEVYKSVL